MLDSCVLHISPQLHVQTKPSLKSPTSIMYMISTSFELFLLSYLFHMPSLAWKQEIRPHTHLPREALTTLEFSKADRDQGHLLLCNLMMSLSLESPSLSAPFCRIVLAISKSPTVTFATPTSSIPFSWHNCDTF